MLVSILLSVFWAVCSTVVVLPWFWKSLIIRKTIIGDENHRGIYKTPLTLRKKNYFHKFLFLQCSAFIVTFTVSMIGYECVFSRRNLFGSTIPIALIIFFQICMINTGWNDEVKFKSGLLIGILAFVICFAVANFWTDYMFNVIGSVDREVDEVSVDEAEMFLPTDNVKAVFNCSMVGEPVYTNDKLVYDTWSPDGVVIIDRHDADTLKFVKAKDNFRKVRYAYPFDLIRKSGAVVSDDNKPYKKYIVAKKEGLFSHPVLQKYVLLDMTTQEITEYQPSELPEFAK